MSRLDTFMMKPVLGLLNKSGADIMAPFRPTHNLPFTLHAFSRRNYSTRRLSGYMTSPAIRYHKSRSMGGF